MDNKDSRKNICIDEELNKIIDLMKKKNFEDDEIENMLIGLYRIWQHKDDWDEKTKSAMEALFIEFEKGVKLHIRSETLKKQMNNL